jgi:hypothetical protein
VKVVYSRLARATGLESPNYWQYFGTRLVDLAEIAGGATVLDIGTDDGSVLSPAAKKAGVHGLGIGVDINFGWGCAPSETATALVGIRVCPESELGSTPPSSGLLSDN